MKNSSLWNCARRSFPVLGICLLAACTSVPKVTVDAAIASNVKSARTAYEAGAFGRAAKHYELALARARALDDSAEIGRNAYNAAACHLRAGDAKTAAALLVEADREFTRNGSSRSPVLILRAQAAMEIGQLAEAESFVKTAEETSSNERERSEAMAAKLDVLIAQGKISDAVKIVETLEREAKGRKEFQAKLESGKGRLHRAKQEHRQAAEAFEKSAKLWSEHANTRELAIHLAAAGEARMKAGDAMRATDDYYRAARSYLGQRNYEASLKCLQDAMKCAEATNDPELRGQIGALFELIKNTVEPAGESL